MKTKDTREESRGMKRKQREEKTMNSLNSVTAVMLGFGGGK